MKIDWAPINIPIQRRLQTLAVASQLAFCLGGEILCLAIILLLVVKGHYILQTLTVIYLVFVYYDRNVAENGGRGAGSQWLRSWSIWKHYADYFPIDLVKTADLRPDRNYLFALFPHGILSSGPFANFNTNHSKFKTLFPGIRAKLMTLSYHFHVPIFREIVLGWGMGPASATCIRTLLGRSTDPASPENQDGYTSNGVMIVVGGAEEALHSRPKNYTVVLKKRRGFVRLALQTGSPIVPVISFNEVDIYNQAENPPGSWLRILQEFIKKVTGVSPVVFMGRGFFQYSFGWIPQRRSITTVVGAPLEVEKKTEPSAEDIAKVHDRFCTELTELFEKHKGKYIDDAEKVHLIIQ